MNTKRNAVLIALTFFLAGLSADSFRIVPNYGHLDRVIALGWDKERDILLTLGEDNYCLVTEIDENRVLNRIPLEGIPAIYALNPVYPEFAVVTEQNASFMLTLLNWQTGEILSQREEKNIPFFLEYSRSGDYLLTGNGSVQLLDHSNGEKAEGPDGITELLSYGYLGGSEKTFMGYSPSGRLIYYDRFTSQIKGRADTEEDLTDLTVLKDDVRLLTARRDGSVFLIDRQTGRVLDTLEKDNILSYNSRSDDGTVTILEEDGDEQSLTTYSIRRDKFSRITEKKIDSEMGIKRAIYTQNSFLLGTEKGEILSLPRRGSSLRNLLSASPLVIDHLSLANHSLLLKNGSNLTIWESPFFEQEGLSTNHLLNITSRSLTLPLEDSLLESFEDRGVFWQPDEEIKYPYYYLNDDRELTALYEPENAGGEEKTPIGFRREISYGFRDLSFYHDLETVIDEDKSCHVYRLIPGESGYDREEIYTYSHAALETAAMVSEKQLAVGTNTYYGGRNGISLTNILTGESVPISDERNIVTQILPDREGKGFYSLGFAARDGVSWAIVKYHDFNDLSGESKSVMDFPQPTTNECEMTLGGEGILYVTSPDGTWRSSETVNTPSSSSLDKVYAKGGYLFLIDRDHSLVIYREETLAPVARAYFFEGGEWMAIGADKRHYFYSSKARDLFNVYKVLD